MKTYLLTWKPERWQWTTIAEEKQQIEQYGFVEDRWSCGRNKSIIAGDRLFLLSQGRRHRGVVASGWAISDVFEDDHFDPTPDKPTALYISLRFDVLLNPDNEPIYPRQNLEQGKFVHASKMHWNTQGSGILIKSDVAAILESEWTKFLVNKNFVQGSGRPFVNHSPNEVPDSNNYYEGATKSVRVNVYERNDKARRDCIKYYGVSCYICGFNFGEVYGEMGLGIIHVHHLKPLSAVKANYRVDPIRDLRPVCPNCHAIIHSRKQPYSIEEVKLQINR